MRKLLLQFVLPLGLLVVGFVSLRSYSVRADDEPTGNTWTKPLRKAVAGADRIVVEDLNFHGDGKKPDKEIRGADKVRDLFEQIDIDPTHSGFACGCLGEYWIHIYKGKEKVLTLGYHHTLSVRWHRGDWDGDGLLTPASRLAVPRWFQKHGCDYLEKLRLKELARDRRIARENEQFANNFPKRVRELVLLEGKGAEVAKGVGDDVVLAVAASRALGVSDHSWTSTGNKERTALAAVKTVTGEDFYAGLTKMRDDPVGLRGAARLFFREGYHEKVPAKTRTEWVVRLAVAVFEHGLDEDKPTCLRFLTKETHPAVQVLLRDVLAGKVGVEIRKRAPDREPGLRAGAAVALATLGNEDIKPDLNRLLPTMKDASDIAALEVSLALLGEPKYLEAEHFRLRSYTIGLAGLKAIEKYKGAHGMQALVEGGIHHPWGYVNDEALAVFTRITGKKMTRTEIEAWWKEQRR